MDTSCLNRRFADGVASPWRGAALVGVLLALALLLRVSPAPAEPGNAAEPVDEGPGVAAAGKVPEELAQWLDEQEISPQVALGKLLWERGEAELAEAYLAFEFERDTLLEIFRNATTAMPHRLIKVYKTGDAVALAEAFANERLLGERSDYHRLLNALRSWLFEGDGLGTVTTEEVVAYALDTFDAEPAWVEATLAADFPYNELPEETPEEVTGKLVEKEDGTRILYLWGSPYERGYAYGKLLGPEIFQLWRRFVLLVGAMRGGYNRVVEMQDLVFEFPEPYLDEMKGMFQGLLESVPEEQRTDSPLGRDFMLADLKAGQTLSDWRQFGCSSISMWGEYTEDGRVLTARNLDYMSSARVMADSHVLVVNAPIPAQEVNGVELAPRKGWVSMAFAGTLGAYTAMNEDGLNATIHDTHGHWDTTIGVLTRPHLIRDALETAEPEEVPGSFAEALRSRNGLVPGNVHLSWPREFGDNADGGFAAGLEFDGYSRLRGGVTVRTVAHNDEGASREKLVVTNHHCLRYRNPNVQREGERPLPEARPIPQDSERRFGSLAEAAGQAEPGSVTVDTLREWLQEVAHSGTFHSVVFEPDARRMHAMFAPPRGESAPYQEPVVVDVVELLERAEEYASAGAGVDENDGEE